MLDEDDLDAAVAEGVLSAPHAAALRDFALKRQKERVAIFGPEERFRFMRGFSDFFFAVGIVLLFAGIAYFTYRIPAACLAVAVLAWLLAELLVARMRLVLPGILLSCLFAGFVVMASPVEPWLLSATWIPEFAALADWFISERLQPPTPFLFIPSLVFYGAIGTLAAALFYLRFRLPFALLLIAASLVATVLLTVDRFWPNAADWMQTLTMLGCGVGVFAVAMCFDTSDRERVTRLSDCAFWL